MAIRHECDCGASITLPNSTPFTMNVRCDGVLLDSVAVAPTTMPGGAGVAASLSADRATAAGNDDVANW